MGSVIASPGFGAITSLALFLIPATYSARLRQRPHEEPMPQYQSVLDDELRDDGPEGATGTTCASPVRVPPVEPRDPGREIVLDSGCRRKYAED